MLFFGDFKKNEIANLIGNKDPLGLYPDIDKSNNSSDTNINTSKPKEIHSKDEAMPLEKTNMVHDAIPHYLRAGNCNSSANTNKDEEGTPTLQVNSKIRSISSGNLAEKMSFKSFESIQQSWKRSRTNSCETLDENKINDGNPGSSKDLNFTSNSNEIIEQFNSKTKEIIKTMASLHFSTTDLRNKISQGCTNNNIPIITQVTLGNYQPCQGQGQVRVESYPPAQSSWREIRGFLHKEMNLRIKSSFYDVLSNNEIYLAWTIAFQPPQSDDQPSANRDHSVTEKDSNQRYAENTESHELRGS